MVRPDRYVCWRGMGRWAGGGAATSGHEEGSGTVIKGCLDSDTFRLSGDADHWVAVFCEHGGIGYRRLGGLYSLS